MFKYNKSTCNMNRSLLFLKKHQFKDFGDDGIIF